MASRLASEAGVQGSTPWLDCNILRCLALAPAQEHDQTQAAFPGSAIKPITSVEYCSPVQAMVKDGRESLTPM